MCSHDRGKGVRRHPDVAGQSGRPLFFHLSGENNGYLPCSSIPIRTSRYMLYTAPVRKRNEHRYTTGMSGPQLHVPPPFPAGPEQCGRMTKNRIPSAETEPKRLRSQGRAGLRRVPSGGMSWSWRPAGIWVAGDTGQSRSG